MYNVENFKKMKNYQLIQPEVAIDDQVMLYDPKKDILAAGLFIEPNYDEASKRMFVDIAKLDISTHKKERLSSVHGSREVSVQEEERE
jgi:hypothetical protein